MREVSFFGAGSVRFLLDKYQDGVYDINMKRLELKVMGIMVLALMIQFPVLGYARNNGLINLGAIAFVESSNRPHVIGDGGRAFGAFQIHKALVLDYNKAKGTRLTHQDMLDPSKAKIVALWAFNEYYPRILRHKGVPVTRLALLTCWNMGQGAYLKGKRAHEYEMRYVRALKQQKGGRYGV